MNKKRKQDVEYLVFMFFLIQTLGWGVVIGIINLILYLFK